MPLDIQELRELLAAINQMDIAELSLKNADFELTVRRGSRSADRTPPMEGVTVFDAPTPPVMYEPASLPASQAAEAAIPRQSSPPPKSARRLVEIISPMVGTFYRAPSPDDPPFVDVGDRIQTGQTVCIIEAMKLMNELEAEVTGEVVEILVQNGAPVEYGQPLMRVNPA